MTGRRAVGLRLPSLCHPDRAFAFAVAAPPLPPTTASILPLFTVAVADAPFMSLAFANATPLPRPP